MYVPGLWRAASRAFPAWTAIQEKLGPRLSMFSLALMHMLSTNGHFHRKSSLSRSNTYWLSMLGDTSDHKNPSTADEVRTILATLYRDSEAATRTASPGEGRVKGWLLRLSELQQTVASGMVPSPEFRFRTKTLLSTMPGSIRFRPVSVRSEIRAASLDLVARS